MRRTLQLARSVFARVLRDRTHREHVLLRAGLRVGVPRLDIAFALMVGEQARESEGVIRRVFEMSRREIVATIVGRAWEGPASREMATREIQ